MARIAPSLADFGQNLVELAQSSAPTATFRQHLNNCWTSSKLAGIAAGNFPGRVLRNFSATFGQPNYPAITGLCKAAGVASLLLYSGASEFELRIHTVRKAFWSLLRVLTSESLAMSVRRLRWEAEVALVLAFGAWSWRWSHDVCRAINAMVIRMLRTMVDIPRKRRRDVADLSHANLALLLGVDASHKGGAANHRDQCASHSISILHGTHSPEREVKTMRK